MVTLARNWLCLRFCARAGQSCALLSAGMDGRASPLGRTRTVERCFGPRSTRWRSFFAILSSHPIKKKVVRCVTCLPALTGMRKYALGLPVKSTWGRVVDIYLSNHAHAPREDHCDTDVHRSSHRAVDPGTAHRGQILSFFGPLDSERSGARRVRSRSRAQ